MSVRIVDLRRAAAQIPAPGAPKRSAEARAALAATGLPESADHDAFMAVYDASADMAKSGTIHTGDGAIGEISRKPMEGRPDLAIVHGRGTGGCSYVMAVRVPPAPAKVKIVEKNDARSWADNIELDLEEQRQEIKVKR